MAISDEQIKELIDWFVNTSETHKAWSGKRREGVERHHKWIQPDVIRQMSDDELEERFLEYYNSNAGDKQTLIKLNRDRIIRDKERFRRTLGFLLDEAIDIKRRVDDILDGDYQIDGFGRGILTALLTDFDSGRYCVWNNKTEMGFKTLGWKVHQRGETQGKTYQRVLADLNRIRELRPDLDLPLIDIDLFLHTISAEEEGKEIVKEIIGDVDSETSCYWQIAPGDNARLWDDLRESSLAAIGFSPLNIDLAGKSKDELLNLFHKYHTGATEMEAKINVTQIWYFLNLKPGDRFVTNKGKSALLGLGIVRGGYRFKPERREYKHTIDVEYYKVTDMGIPIPDKYRGKFGKTIVPLTKQDFTTLVELFDAEHAIPNFWWVCQGKSYTEDTGMKFLWAPKAGAGTTPYHWKNIKRLNQGDVVFNYANGAIQGVSIVKGAGYDYLHEESTEWNKEGIRVDITHYKLNPIAISDLKPAMQALSEALKEKAGPFDASGGVKQGYLFEFNLEAARILRDIYGSQFPSPVERYLGAPEVVPLNPAYTLSQCAIETGFDEATLSRWIRAVERKGQAILYGPPDTCKTYIAELLVKHLIGGSDGFSELVQFHPAYAYEDFMQGIRPEPRDDGSLSYPVVPGRFLDFCRRAGERGGRCVLIIDEINRANLSRVFGELMYLLEYRDRKIPLAGGGEFYIPANVRIMGTMNTADRSIALVDHALRRRFAFLALYPNYEVLRKFHQRHGFPAEGLIGVLETLNRKIGDPHYEVGITFFLREDLSQHVEDVWKMEIEPYLEEYFFDRRDTAKEFSWARVKDKILS